MSVRMKRWGHMMQIYGGFIEFSRFYGSKVDFKKLRPMILKRIQDRANEFPVKPMVPVASQVLKSRMLLIHGVSTLLQFVPLLGCKFCHEVYIGELRGHLIQNCHGNIHRVKNQVHEWIIAGLNDILVPVETFHLDNMFQEVIKHDQRFDFDRIPAVVELCWQAGARQGDENIKMKTPNSGSVHSGVNQLESLSTEDLRHIANKTLKAWETLRSGVEKLLLVYPAKVCEYCSEVHIGPTGHKARNCGVFKYESWRGTHVWKKAGVDNLVPPKFVWCRRPQDPPVLLNGMQQFYGHAPAVVDLCWKAGAVVPTKYHCMMKVNGLSRAMNSS
ncbi:hypothetical protein K2173_027368 [Erythroxylum novogranatense]|uniref:APO domain-containing protein n=1 Tax=Erythroxylum novogranatense TaxID=1862640 RepID=A0AAV8TYX2_9ROSI|nr:hypothetical protein K2173_027368 [Erythroxylum novogranatense]